jgi:ATP diphosphatase
MANLARHLGIEPETALQETNAKFKSRFDAMEAAARADGRSFREMSLDEQDALWDRVKAQESDRMEGRGSDPK